MGEIVCHNCNKMYSHLDFHDGMKFCDNCLGRLGIYCSICSDYVCDNCHLGEHVYEEFDK